MNDLREITTIRYNGKIEYKLDKYFKKYKGYLLLKNINKYDMILYCGKHDRIYQFIDKFIYIYDCNNYGIKSNIALNVFIGYEFQYCVTLNVANYDENLVSR